MTRKTGDPRLIALKDRQRKLIEVYERAFTRMSRAFGKMEKARGQLRRLARQIEALENPKEERK